MRHTHGRASSLPCGTHLLGCLLGTQGPVLHPRATECEFLERGPGQLQFQQLEPWKGLSQEALVTRFSA